MGHGNLLVSYQEATGPGSCLEGNKTLGAIRVFQVPESGWLLPILLEIRPRGVWGSD